MPRPRPQARLWYGKPYPWFKSPLATYHDPALAELDGHARAVLQACRAIASLWQWDDAGIGWLVKKSGEPKTCAQIARVAAFPPARVRRALADLVDAGALVFRDGCYGVAGFGPSQVTPATARRAKRRSGAEMSSDMSEDKSRDDRDGLSRESEISESSSSKKKEEDAGGHGPASPETAEISRSGRSLLAAIGRAGTGKAGSA